MKKKYFEKLLLISLYFITYLLLNRTQFWLLFFLIISFIEFTANLSLEKMSNIAITIDVVSFQIIFCNSFHWQTLFYQVVSDMFFRKLAFLTLVFILSHKILLHDLFFAVMVISQLSLIKLRLWRRYFLMNFAKFLKTPFL